MMVLMACVGLPSYASSPVIVVDKESLDFGELTLGYPATLTLCVTGSGLSSDVTLTVNGDKHPFQYEVTPQVITPQELLGGKTVKVKLVPSFWGDCNADLLISSAGADPVVVPMTSHVNGLNATITRSMTVPFVSGVGQMSRTTEVLRWSDADVPTDPNTPVVRSSGGANRVAPGSGSSAYSRYNLRIEGDPSFSLMITKASEVVKTCTVVISYCPMSEGSHQATLIAECQGASPMYITLDGSTDYHISNVTNMIDILLAAQDDEIPNAVDFNTDGCASISDVSFVIDKLLAK